MNFWHFQMHLPEGSEEGIVIDPIAMLREFKPLIGTGDWDHLQCRHFKGESGGLELGSIVMVRRGNEPLALVKVVSDYFTEEELENRYVHHLYRHVEILDWNIDGRRSSLFSQGTLKVLYESSDSKSWNYINKWYLEVVKMSQLRNCINVITYKKQIILQGPPGTGKTKRAKEIADALTRNSEGGSKNAEQCKLIQFHPSYTYEDFVRGIVAESKGAQIEYKNVNKLLGTFAKVALEDFESSQRDNTPFWNYVLIIDEINRANLSSVLGELIYALEYRGEKVESMYAVDGKTELVLPPNLYIIGTMNTADRSAGRIDYAIRRRFAFVDVLPSDSVLDEAVTSDFVRDKAKALFGKVAALFVQDNLLGDFKPNEVQLGHSYFIAEEQKDLELKLTYEIKPLLREYVRDGILKTTVRIGNADFDTEKYIDGLSL